MQLKLGNKIRELRRRDDRTQEELAAALGVTGQAVSRWEAGGGYPDMELMPPLANYFSVTIDELFGYDSDRDRRIKLYTDKYDALERSRDDTEAMLVLMREAAAEFPSSEPILIRLAQALSYRGWDVHGARAYNTDESDYAYNDSKYNSKNEYWMEELKILDKLLLSRDPDVRERAVSFAVSTCRLVGEYDRAAEIARGQPTLDNCRELLLATGADGEESGRYNGEAIIKLVSSLSNRVIFTLAERMSLARSDTAVTKLRGMIELYNLIFDDGRCGYYHLELRELHLWLALYCWRTGNKDDTFTALNGALEHAHKFEELYAMKGIYKYTAPIINRVTDDVSQYRVPKEASEVSQLASAWQISEETCPSLRADPRWDAWVANTKTLQN
jgi:Predicted transcriptional regulators